MSKRAELDGWKQKPEVTNLLNYGENVDTVLKAFDTCQMYGPAGSMDRMNRWLRADKLYLNPPQRVFEILNIQMQHATKH